MENVNVEQLFTEVHDMKKKVSEMYYALIGSPLSQDGGMVRDIREQELRIKALEKRCLEIEKAEDKSSFQVKVIWGLGGTVLAALFGFILHLIFK